MLSCYHGTIAFLTMLHFTMSCRTCAYGTPVLRPQFARTCSALVLWTAQICNADHQGWRRCWTLQHYDHYDQKRVCLQTYRSSQVSMTPHASCIRCYWHRMHMIFTFRSCSYIFFGMRCQLHHMHHACGVNDTACTMHAVSMITHAF
jgi:hypothetical protein